MKIKRTKTGRYKELKPTQDRKVDLESIKKQRRYINLATR